MFDLSRFKKVSLRNFLAFAAAFILASNSNAAAVLDFTAASQELAGVQTSLVSLIGALIVILGIGIAWSYFRRTAK